MNIPGDGTVWGINSTQFIREKRLGDYAFYSLDVTADEDLTNIIPEVCALCSSISTRIIVPSK